MGAAGKVNISDSRLEQGKTDYLTTLSSITWTKFHLDSASAQLFRLVILSDSYLREVTI